MKCVVITPVGPGHEQLAEDCRASVQQAVAHSPGPFAEIRHKIVDDTRGALGRSAARNQAVTEARAEGADWLFFLDADDLLSPDAFASVQSHIGRQDAIWGAICAQAAGGSPQLRAKQDRPIRNLMELMRMDPFYSLQMGHFVRTEVAARFPFDTTLNAGEDFDYYLQVWLHQRCCKLAVPLFVNRRGFHSHGPKSATGEQWRKNVTQVMLRFLAAHRDQIQRLAAAPIAPEID